MGKSHQSPSQSNSSSSKQKKQTTTKPSTSPKQPQGFKVLQPHTTLFDPAKRFRQIEKSAGYATVVPTTSEENSLKVKPLSPYGAKKLSRITNSTITDTTKTNPAVISSSSDADVSLALKSKEQMEEGKPLDSSSKSDVNTIASDQLQASRLLAVYFSPKGQNHEVVVGFSPKGDLTKKNVDEKKVKFECAKRLFQADEVEVKNNQIEEAKEEQKDPSSSVVKDDSKSIVLSATNIFSRPNTCGGVVLLTKLDIEYRANKGNGNRSLFPKPNLVMGKTANDAARLAKVYKEGDRWEWGHLLPAGGAPQGLEVNLDPFNFVAIPFHVNTWQMVPEAMARQLAKNGYTVEYTASAIMFMDENNKVTDCAKEIYCQIRLVNTGHCMQFHRDVFDEREAKLPLITDTANLLKYFFEKAQLDKKNPAPVIDNKEQHSSPKKTIPPKQYPYLEQNVKLEKEGFRPGFKKYCKFKTPNRNLNTNKESTKNKKEIKNKEGDQKKSKMSHTKKKK